MKNNNISINNNKTIFLRNFYKIQLTSNKKINYNKSKYHLQKKLTLKLIK